MAKRFQKTQLFTGDVGTRAFQSASHSGVFCYDVTDNKRRRRVAQALEDAAVRVQKSVFEARMTERAANRLAATVAAHLAPGDSLRVYAIGAHGQTRSRSYGGAPLAEAQDFYLL